MEVDVAKGGLKSLEFSLTFRSLQLAERRADHFVAARIPAAFDLLGDAVLEVLGQRNVQAGRLALAAATGNVTLDSS